MYPSISSTLFFIRLALLELIFFQVLVQNVECTITKDFLDWLKENKLEKFDFARTDITGGSFGGKQTREEIVRKTPVIFVHGNSDRALGGRHGGWSKVKKYFELHGYSEAELYATTWGPASDIQAAMQTHTLKYIEKVRQFIKAVLQYTAKDAIHIVSHSMGVTLSRKAILGGKLEGTDLGEPMTKYIQTFIGIAGANYGLTACFTGPTIPTCNAINGFYPGVYNPILQTVVMRSKFLNDLLSKAAYEGKKRYAIWTPDDNIIKYNCIVYGKVTSKFPEITRDIKVDGMDHFQVKSDTAEIQYKLIHE